MKLLVCLCCVVLFAALVSAGDKEWDRYKKKFRKVYANPEEDEKRRAIYYDSKAKVEEHNERYARGEVSYRQGINRFADFLPEERKKLLGGGPPTPPNSRSAPIVPQPSV